MREAFVKAIAELLDGIDRSQIEIARILGYENANIITMFKKGTTRIPPEKVVPFALALEQDPGQMLRQWFAAYMPKVLSDVEKYLIPGINRTSKGTPSVPDSRMDCLYSGRCE